MTAIFLTVDLAFFGANLIKVTAGRLAAAASSPTLLFTLMTTWKTGRRLVAERLTARATPIDVFMASLKALGPGARARHGGVHDRAAHAARRRRWCTTCATTRCCTTTS